MSNLRKFISMSAVAMLGVTNLLSPLSYASAATKYDALTTSDLTNNPLDFEMPDKDVSLYAITDRNTYYVEYNGNGSNSGDMANSTFYYDITGSLATGAYEKLGHTFDGWNTEQNGSGTSYAENAKVWNWTGRDQATISIYAQWIVNRYNIAYALNDDPRSPASHPETPTSGAYGDTLTIDNPSRTGYNFSGWHIVDMEEGVEHKLGTTTSTAGEADYIDETEFKNLRATEGTVTFGARWKAKDIEYTIKHYLQDFDNTYPSTPAKTTTGSGPTDSEVEAARETFIGFTQPNVQTGLVNGDGTTEFRYEYTRNPYDLTLYAGRGVDLVSASGTVTAEDSTNTNKTITFKFDEPVTLNFELKLGYGTGVWTGSDANTDSFRMPADNISRTAYAVPTNYWIEVNNMGGNDGTASRYYTVEEAVKLNTPWRAKSYFAGWTGTDIVGTNDEVLIETGSIGDRSYTATWTCHSGYNDVLDKTECTANEDTKYTVRHIGQDLSGDLKVMLNSGVIQTGQTDTITDAHPLTFPGFIVDKIGTGNIDGDQTRVVDILYRRLAYSGNIAEDVPGIASVTATGPHDVDGKHKYEDIVTITATTGAGYTFNGWTLMSGEDDISSLLTDSSAISTTFQMPAGDVTIIPSATENVYHITFELNGGTGVNDRDYTVTQGVKVDRPDREHSTFVGWSGTDIEGKVFDLIIATGSIGDRSYEANWECVAGYHDEGGDECVANTYKVVQQDINEEHGAADPVVWTYDQRESLDDPEQSGYTFAGWNIYDMSGDVIHYVGTIEVTESGYNSAHATGYMNLTTELSGTVIFVAQWTPNPDTDYVVNHYYKLAGVDGYELSGTDHLTGTTDSELVLTGLLKNKFGFTYSGGYEYTGGYTGDGSRPEGAGVATGTIDKHGTTVINLYYDRNRWTLTVDGDGNTYDPEGSGVYDFGEDVEAKIKVKTGYHFKTWSGTPAPTIGG